MCVSGSGGIVLIIIEKYELLVHHVLFGHVVLCLYLIWAVHRVDQVLFGELCKRLRVIGGRPLGKSVFMQHGKEKTAVAVSVLLYEV